MGYIVDLSHHQDPKRIDYDTFAKHLDWAIIRTQYGSNTIDRHYKTHHAELRKRGVPTAAYAWVRGVSIEDMRKEAEDFYKRTLEAVEPTFGFWMSKKSRWKTCAPVCRRMLQNCASLAQRKSESISRTTSTNLSISTLMKWMPSGSRGTVPTMESPTKNRISLATSGNIRALAGSPVMTAILI